MTAEALSAVLIDVGRVLIHPQNALFHEAAVIACSMSLKDADIETALAETVWVGARSADPVAFWAGTEHKDVWGRSVGMRASQARKTWAVLAELDTDDSPLWSVTEPQAKPVLADLRSRGILIAAVSNGNGELTRDLMRHGLLDYFDTVLDSHIEGVAKPDSAIFDLAAARLGVPLAHCGFVGDDPYFDYDASLKAGAGASYLIDHFDSRPKDWTGSAARTLAAAVAGVLSTKISSDGTV